MKPFFICLLSLFLISPYTMGVEGQNSCLYPNNTPFPMSQGMSDILYSLGRPQIHGLNTQNFSYSPQDIREIYYSGYISFFNTKTKTAFLTIHRLDHENKAAMVSRKKKGLKFYPESRLPGPEQVFHKDYIDVSANLSRGHFTPSSWANNPKFRQDTFSTANIAPQVQRSFNDELWNNLEICSRIWRDQGYKINVMTGVLFHYPQHKQIPSMPQSDVKIPSHFYKIFIYHDDSGKENRIKVLSFLMENRGYQPSELSLDNYLTDYRMLQRLSGIEFFPDAKNSKFIDQEHEVWPGCEAFLRPYR